MDREAEAQAPPTPPTRERDAAPIAATETSAAPPTSSHAPAAPATSSASSSKPRSAGSAFSFGRALRGAGGRAAQTVPTAHSSASASNGPPPAPARSTASGPPRPAAAAPPPNAPTGFNFDDELPPVPAPVFFLPPMSLGPKPTTPVDYSNLTIEGVNQWMMGLSQDKFMIAFALNQDAKNADWTLTTPERATAAQAQADQLTQQGETYKAHPLLCNLAMYSLATRGWDHAESVRAVYRVVHSTYMQDYRNTQLESWLLGRVVENFGIDSPDTRWLVQHVAAFLCKVGDAREHVALARRLTDIAQQLPGGLGWGNTTVTDVPDEQTYYKHVVLQERGMAVANQAQHKEGIQFLQRCVAYYDTLGPHWLATARKIRCLRVISQCVMFEEGPAAAEPLLRESKRVAQRELGLRHPETLDITWAYAEALRNYNRLEPALSLFQKTLRVREEVMGAGHSKVMDSQMPIAMVLLALGRVDQCFEAFEKLFSITIKTQGPTGGKTRTLLSAYWNQLIDRGKLAEAQGLKRRAAELGCAADVACVPGLEYIARVQAENRMDRPFERAFGYAPG